MPRLALISDIHGNLEALVAVLRSVEQANVDHIVCLGDVVGYGPDPGPCVELISSVCDAVVHGNHDEASLVEEAPANFNPTAARSLRLTRSLLNNHHFDTIGGWPARSQIAGVHLAHATFGLKIYSYVLNKEAAAESLKGLDAPIGAFGHTHVPALFTCPLEADPSPATVQSSLPMPADVLAALPRQHRVLINPGSVGQPRDRNPDASWGLLDTDAGAFRTRRIAYDIDAVERKIRDAGLPDLLGQRLRIGA